VENSAGNGLLCSPKWFAQLDFGIHVADMKTTNVKPTKKWFFVKTRTLAYINEAQM